MSAASLLPPTNPTITSNLLLPSVASCTFFSVGDELVQTVFEDDGTTGACAGLSSGRVGVGHKDMWRMLYSNPPPPARVCLCFTIASITVYTCC